MKKRINHKITTTGSNSISVFAILSQTRILKLIVDQLAARRYDIGYSLQKVQPGWQAFDTSSIESYASGELSLLKNSEPLTLSFDANFLFTCIKTKVESYNLTWMNSLS